MFVNATEMAKQFGVKPESWLRTEQSQRIIGAISTSQKCEVNYLVKVTYGGDNPGTWMYEDIALVFSQWLSPNFYIWCNSKIKELAKNGYIKLDSISKKDLARMLYESEVEPEESKFEDLFTK